MDFAKKILGKYGWKEGDGLGKHNDGIAAPLKASLKFDNAGLGVDRAQEFNDHWWERCFNEATNNVDVQVGENGKITTSRKEGEEAVEISTKGFSARKLKKAKDQHASDGKATYDNFLQTSLLTQGGGEVENTERIRVEDIAVSKVSVLTDEELFKACGGRTAHKGARHGLKLSGKIARLEQQEREMLEKLQAKQNPVQTNKITKPETEETKEEPVKTKKKKSSKEKYSENVSEDQVELSVKSKKKKKDKKLEKSQDESSTDLNQETEENVEETQKKKKKKKNKDKETEVTTDAVNSPNKRKAEESAEEPVKSKKKKKNKHAKEE
ncbi:G patch domain-containing protein 4 [Drosophila bipectinata]|uniref:G patch domain-containing protein 4 n=1 Tax=Drosophila bipectinata TaxID=42026 RepID=UPI001C89BBA4|nr:G patch domain-containing protein 4 [Drosophila bipectinata]